MIDYKEGDDIVAVRSSLTIKVGQIGKCLYAKPAKKKLPYICTDCKTKYVDAICVVWDRSTTNKSHTEGYCSCTFRKALDFKKLCNVEERKKVDA